MPRPVPIPKSRRAWIVTWAVLCAAGLAATYVLTTSSEPEPPPKKPVSARCAELIKNIEGQIAKNERDGKKDGVVAFSRIRGAGQEDCGDALRDHFGSNR
ncbi:hypothetical protein [Streptomyces sp. NPDC002790]|uniref:hypothetical protein n=1 Tax=Streptomyces sp. NPDC002790 TaxID=3154431 RepID=UPI003331F691